MNDAQRAWFERDGVAVLTELGFAPGQRVLDFGCGPGRFTAPLSRIVCGDGGRVIAVDRSRDNLEQLGRTLDACGQASTVDTVLVEDGDHIDAMEIAPVDAVLAFDVLQHVKDWGRFFEAALAILRPHGVLYIYPAAVPHPDLVDMEAIRRMLGDHGLAESDCRRVHLPHANHMVKDTVHLFGSRDRDFAKDVRPN